MPTLTTLPVNPSNCVSIMKYWTILAACTLILSAQGSYAGDKVEAAIGGAAGGAVGAVIGDELGDRKGAIIGAAAGAAIGAAIATDDDGHEHGHAAPDANGVAHNTSSGKFCPPGQAKKGNC